MSPISLFYTSCRCFYSSVSSLSAIELLPSPTPSSISSSIPALRILATLGYQLSVMGIYSPGRTGTVTVTRSKVTSLEDPVSTELQLYQLSVYMPVFTFIYSHFILPSSLYCCQHVLIFEIFMSC